MKAQAPASSRRLGPGSKRLCRWLRAGGVLAASLPGVASASESAGGAGSASELSGAPTQAGEERDPVLVRPFVQVLFAEVDFEGDGGAQLEFVPNPTSNAGVTLGAWGFTLSASFGIGHVQPESEYGDSHNFNLELSNPFEVLAGRELDVTAFLHYHRTLSAYRAGAARQVVEDAVITTLGIDTQLTLSPRFSLAAAFTEFRPRDGSSGSFFLRSALEFWFLGFLKDPTRSLVAPELSDGLDELLDLNRMNEASLTLGGGYAYDWNPFDRLFLSALGSLGLTAGLSRLSFTSEPEQRSAAIGPSVGLQLVLSYVSRGFHAGVVSSAVVDSLEVKAADIMGVRAGSALFFGMRF